MSPIFVHTTLETLADWFFSLITTIKINKKTFIFQILQVTLHREHRSSQKPQPSLPSHFLSSLFHFSFHSGFVFVLPSKAHDNSTTTDHFPAAASFLYHFPCRCGKLRSCAARRMGPRLGEGQNIFFS